MSDSLKATVIVIVPLLTISANGELEELLEDEEELDPPRLPAVDDPPANPELPELIVLEELELDALVLELADTASPGSRSARDAIVPLTGA